MGSVFPLFPNCCRFLLLGFPLFLIWKFIFLLERYKGRGVPVLPHAQSTSVHSSCSQPGLSLLENLWNASGDPQGEGLTHQGSPGLVPLCSAPRSWNPSAILGAVPKGTKSTILGKKISFWCAGGERAAERGTGRKDGDKALLHHPQERKNLIINPFSYSRFSFCLRNNETTSKTSMENLLVLPLPLFSLCSSQISPFHSKKTPSLLQSSHCHSERFSPHFPRLEKALFPHTSVK